MQKTVLIVDDEPDMRQVLRDRLESQGYRVWEARSGERALELMSAKKPDLVLLDVMMPNMNGHQLWRNLQKNENFKEVPVIILSARTRLADRYWGAQLQSEDYLVKSLGFDQVLDRIAHKLGHTDAQAMQ